MTSNSWVAGTQDWITSSYWFFFFGFFLFFKIILFSYLLLALLGLRCCVEAFSSCSELGLLSHCGVRASHYGRFSCCRALALEHWLWSTGSVVVHGLSCFSACRIFLDQGSNLCLLPWQVDSLPQPPGEAPSYSLFTPVNCGILSCFLKNT